jgi:hypothetical protein
MPQKSRAHRDSEADHFIVPFLKTVLFIGRITIHGAAISSPGAANNAVLLESAEDNQF